MSDSFFSRWSRRKLDVRDGKPLAEPAAEELQAPEKPRNATNNIAGYAGSTRANGQKADADRPLETSDAPLSPPPAGDPPAEPATARAKAPLPTLADAQALNPESDFKPFMARGVAPEVKNAAVKKLFADPHFNVMDGMDVYVDDYSVSTPIPKSVLRQMASAKFLGLFDEEEKQEAAQAKAEADAAAAEAQARDVPDGATPQDVPQSAAFSAPAEVPSNPDDHTDLRLQPNHAAGARSSGPRAG